MRNIRLQPTRHYDVIDFSQTRSKEAWREHRRSYLGASEMPILMGAASEAWGSPFQLQAQKLGLIKKLERDPGVVEMMNWGLAMEPLVITALGRELKARVRHNTTTIRSKRWPWLGCTPDGRVGLAYDADGRKYRQANVQAKNCAGFERWAVREDGIMEPRRVWVQVQAEMAVTGDPYTYVVALIGAWNLRWTRVDRSNEYIEEHLIPQGEQFMQHLETGEMLPPDFSDGTTAALTAMFPKAEPDKAIRLPATFTEEDDLYVELAEKRKEIDQQMKQIANSVREQMGDAARADVQGRGGFPPYWLWYDVKGSTVTRKPGRTLRRFPGKEE